MKTKVFSLNKSVLIRFSGIIGFIACMVTILGYLSINPPQFGQIISTQDLSATQFMCEPLVIPNSINPVDVNSLNTPSAPWAHVPPEFTYPTFLIKSSYSTISPNLGLPSFYLNEAVVNKINNGTYITVANTILLTVFRKPVPNNINIIDGL